MNGKIYYSMKETRVLAERWRVHFAPSSHGALGVIRNLRRVDS